ncbi:MAG TPA: hypothetical protein VK645_08900 [Chitinophagaceae bacterium]|nr:hypothetical protein [Chitinophagaceae bacterium]
MPLAIFFLTRLLFITSMVFIMGYVFGNFSKSTTLTKITKIASIFILVSFIAVNIMFFRLNRGWRCGNFNRSDRFENYHHQKDSTTVH